MCALNSSGGGRQPLLCYVTDRRGLDAPAGTSSIDLLLPKVEEIISAGVDWVQIREKDLAGKELTHLVRETLRIAAKHSANPACTRILVNDRIDVALAEGADGAHLAEDSLPAAEAKQLAQSYRAAHGSDSDFLVGVSCHSREAAEAAAASGADYIFFGPIFATPSKAAYGAPQGLERLKAVSRAVSVPVLAIGGITPENAALCLAAGASGIAAIRLFQDSSNAARDVALLREALSRS